MTPWVDDETGEVMSDGCPNCDMLEREARNYRAKITKLQNDAERNLVARRDGKTWKDAIAYWQAAFPDRRISSKGIKSARATRYFQRLEAGATPEDVRYAIDAATVWCYVVFGKRRRAGSKSDLAVDLQEIVSVGNDAQFDGLVELGRTMVLEAFA